MDTPSLCFEDDDFVRDRLRWVVQLSDGRFVFEDDERPGMDPPQAWIRLKQYLALHPELHITKMFLQHRGNVLPIPDLDGDAEGYYLMKLAYGMWGDPNSYSAYIAGPIKEGKACVQKYKTPELIPLDDHEEREIDVGTPSAILRKVGLSS